MDRCARKHCVKLILYAKQAPTLFFKHNSFIQKQPN